MMRRYNSHCQTKAEGKAEGKGKAKASMNTASKSSGPTLKSILLLASSAACLVEIISMSSGGGGGLGTSVGTSIRYANNANNNHNNVRPPHANANARANVSAKIDANTLFGNMMVDAFSFTTQLQSQRHLANRNGNGITNGNGNRASLRSRRSNYRNAFSNSRISHSFSTISQSSTSSSSSSSQSSTSTSTSLQMEVINCDVAIIGGGPAGCTCGLYTARGNLKTVIIDKNPSAGALAITSTIANYPGIDPSTSGMQLLDNMRMQAVDYGAIYRQAQVFMVDFGEEEEGSSNDNDNENDNNNENKSNNNNDAPTKTVYTPDLTVHARALVLATGALGRKPTFQGEADYLGKGVSYCATCDGAFYQNSPVAVVGSTSEAIQEAEFLTKFASTVHWITPTDPIQVLGQDVVNDFLGQHDNVQQWEDTRMTCIDGDMSGVTGIQLKRKGVEDIETLDVEGVFIYGPGAKPITDYIGSRVQYRDDGGVYVDDEMSTSVPGVYAIGDIRNTPYKQVVVAASDGCIAAMSIDKYLKGRKNIKVDWIHQ